MGYSSYIVATHLLIYDLRVSNISRQSYKYSKLLDFCSLSTFIHKIWLLHNTRNNRFYGVLST